MKKIKINFDKKKIIYIYSSLKKYRSLLFFIFLVLSFLFCFQVIYSNFFNKEIISHEENKNLVVSEAIKVEERVQIILENINKRTDRSNSRIVPDYENPFRFNNDDIQVEKNDYNVSNSYVETESIGVSAGF